MMCFISGVCEYLMLKKIKELKKEISELREICSNNNKEILQRGISDSDLFNKEKDILNKLENEKNGKSEKNEKNEKNGKNEKNEKIDVTNEENKVDNIDKNNDINDDNYDQMEKLSN